MGEGGMGQVYRARDTKLNRDVALKVLPEAFAGDVERLARVTREAQTLASLNHPNIAAIYGIEGHALVMELVEGDDLSAHIARGPMSLGDALPIARQIAEALEAAHEAGIIHRDLKPANVKVRADGTVKLLDFGLAKAFQVEGSRSRGQDPFPVPTTMLSPAITQRGMILGTAAYMAPEQARGKAVDKRADIWAFGVVLFEMLTGRRAFAGDAISDVLASVLKTDPDWSALPVGAPPALQRLLRRCLEKDPRQRLRDIGDARLMLVENDELLSGAPPRVGMAVPSPPLWRRALPLAGAVVLTLAVVAAIAVLRAPSLVAPEVVRFSAVLGDATSGMPVFSDQLQGDFMFTNDGRALIYGSETNTGARFVSIRRFDQLTSTAIAGSDHGIGPFISPDDKWVGFLDPSFSYISKVPTAGGAARTLVQSQKNITSAAWLGDGTIVYSVSGAGLFAVPDGGGAPVQLTTLDAAAGDTNHLCPAAVPGSQGVLFVIASGDPLRTGRLAVLSRATGRVTRTDVRGTSPRFLATGHVVYVDASGSLLAVPFDAGRLQFTGSPVPTGEHVGVSSTGAAFFDVSRNGRIAYGTTGIQAADRTLVWVDRAGRISAGRAASRLLLHARLARRRSTVARYPRSGAGHLDLGSAGHAWTGLQRTGGRSIRTVDARRPAPDLQFGSRRPEGAVPSPRRWRWRARN